MSENPSVSLQALVQFALPLGSSVAAGSSETAISWAVTIRAQPPAFPDIAQGELALVSMDVLRSYDSRITLSEVVRSLAAVGVPALAVADQIAPGALAVAEECGVSLIALPADASLSRVERAVNKLIVNQTAQLNQRALEIQRQLTATAAENRSLNNLLMILARATARPVLVHDDAGVLIAQVSSGVSRHGSRDNLLQSVPYSAFQNWLKREAPGSPGAILRSPIGFTTVLKVEKRVAGYLSLVDVRDTLDEFNRLVMSYGADVCAIELAKNRAIASAVEQTRGDWVQMWLSGTPADDDMLTTRAAQAGFDASVPFAVVVLRASTQAGRSLPLESLLSLVRDDMARREIAGAAGLFVDVLVALYPLRDDDEAAAIKWLRDHIGELRDELVRRTPGGVVAAGISRPVAGLPGLRDAYREARDAISIAVELGTSDAVTFYGDLKLYQLLLSIKEQNLPHLIAFYSQSLRVLVEHDERKGGDLVRTLNGFFEANGNLAKAAVDLDVHRNTLVYRLEQVARLTGLDLNQADNRLILHLALKIQRVLATLPINGDGT